MNPINDLPTLNTIADVTIDEDAPQQTISLTGANAGGGESQPLRITASSNNTGLIPNPNVSYTSPDSTGSLSFTPIADQHGTATITITIEDGGFDGNLNTTGDNATFSRTFDVTVNPVNDAPTLNTVADVTIDEDAAQQTICLLYTSPSPRDVEESRMPSSA